jgi:hypothetical protein
VRKYTTGLTATWRRSCHLARQDGGAAGCLAEVDGDEGHEEANGRAVRSLVRPLVVRTLPVRKVLRQKGAIRV